MSHIKSYATALLAIIMLTACSEEGQKEGDAQPYYGIWKCNELQNTEWDFSDDGNMEIVYEGVHTGQQVFQFQILENPGSIVFYTYQFNGYMPTKIVIAQYGVLEITDDTMRIVRTYANDDSSQTGMMNPFSNSPVNLTFTRHLL